MSRELMGSGEGNYQQMSGLIPKNYDDMLRFAEIIASSTLAPKDYAGKPGNVLVAIQMGAEIGLMPMQALQNIAVINGRPCVWGDAMLALVKAHPDFEDISEYIENNIAICKVKRRNQTETVSSFSMQDAKTAGLLGKQGPWSTYPLRMLQLRARGFALRDAFPDALKGIISREEAEDMHHKEKKQNSYSSNKVYDNISGEKESGILQEQQLQEFIALCIETNSLPENVLAYACKQVLKIDVCEFEDLSGNSANIVLGMLKDKKRILEKEVAKAAQTINQSEGN